MTTPNNILVVAAHPDDEVLGCGGTIARHAYSGNQAQVLFVAEASKSRQLERDRAQVQDELSALATAAQTAATILGAEGVGLLELSDNRLDSLDRLGPIHRIEQCAECHQPESIYFHYVGDWNVDHRRLHEGVVTTCCPTPGHVVKRLLGFEVASSTDWQVPGSAPAFQPCWFGDISEQCGRKREALLAYTSQIRDWTHARSLEALDHLASWRGVQLGVAPAESFCLTRQLV